MRCREARSQSHAATRPPHTAPAKRPPKENMANSMPHTQRKATPRWEPRSRQAGGRMAGGLREGQERANPSGSAETRPAIEFRSRLRLQPCSTAARSPGEQQVWQKEGREMLHCEPAVPPPGFRYGRHASIRGHRVYRFRAGRSARWHKQPEIRSRRHQMSRHADADAVARFTIRSWRHGQSISEYDVSTRNCFAFCRQTEERARGERHARPRLLFVTERHTPYFHFLPSPLMLSRLPFCRREAPLKAR